MSDIVMLAQANHLLWAFLLAMVVYLVIMGSGSRRERKQFAEMLANLKKGDRVMTIGGIIATVVTVSGDEVVLKVDESANVKITVIRSAVKKVLTEEPRAGDLK